MTAPRVFISYSQDSDEHMESVLVLANRLRGNGVDCILDQYVDAPPEGWPTWMASQVKHAEFVLVVCTAEHQRRFDPQHPVGAGSRFESVLIVQQLHNDRMSNTRFLPVLLGDATPAEILEPLQSYSHYRADTQQGYDALLRRLLKQPAVVPPDLGKPPPLPPRELPARGLKRSSDEPSNYRCQAPHPGADFVHRGELDTMVERLTSSTDDDTTTASTLAITTALQGAGGFGKTTLAQALCHHEKVQGAFPDGVLWIVMGEGLDDAGRIRSILDSLRAWTGANPPAFESAAAAGIHLRDLLNGRRVLVVVDDAWQRGDIRPFEGLGEGSALLITTRNRQILPPNIQPLDVNELEPSVAMKLFAAGLGGKMQDFEPLARQLGQWPLLLKLVNGQLRKLTALGIEVVEALERVSAKLHDHGLSAFDHRDAEAREDAVRLTMAAGFESGVLNEDDQGRYHSLAIFPEDADIPIGSLASYWGLKVEKAEELAERLFDLSLLQRFDLGPGSLKLHDVFRHYLIHEQRLQLAELNRRFLEAHRPESGRWADLSPSADYLWRHLAHHLVEAEKAETLAELLVDLDYLQVKLQTTDVNSLLSDFKRLTVSPPRLLLADAIRKSAHCLNRDPNQLTGQLLGRISECDQPTLRLLTEQLRTSSGLLPRRGSLRPAGGPLRRTLEGHFAGVRAVKSLKDGRIVSASDDQMLRVWDVESGKCLHTLKGHSSLVLVVDRLEDERIVSGSADGTLRVWDVESGECLHTLRGHAAWVVAVARLEGGRIVSASDDWTLRVWDAESGACLQMLQGHTAWVVAVDRLEGGRIVSASSDGSLRVWDVESGECLHTLRGHTAWIRAVKRLEDGRIVSASDDWTLRVWDVESGECLYTLRGHRSSVLAVKRLEDGRIVSASSDGSLRVWDVTSSVSGICQHSLRGHTEAVRDVEHLEGSWIISTSFDRTLRVWDVESGDCLRTLRGHTAWVLACEHLESARFVSASYDGTLRVWDVAASVEDGRQLHSLRGHHAGVLVVRESVDGTLVSASDDGTLRVWDVESGECLKTLNGHRSGVRALERLDDGRIVSASDDGTLRVWDVTAPTGSRSEYLMKSLEGHSFMVRAIERLEGGRVVSASYDRTLRVWDVESGECLQELRGHTAEVRAVKRLEAGRIVSASSDGTLRVWDVDSGECLKMLDGHTKGVRAVERLEGNRIVSASEDRSLRMWDVESGECLHTLEGHSAGVVAVECLGGERIVSASEDKTLRVWDVESGASVAVFTGEGPISAVTVVASNLIVAGDAAGRVHILDLVEPGRSNEP